MDAQHANRSRVGASFLNSGEVNRVSRTHLVLEGVRIAETRETLEIANLVETPTRNSKELEQVATSVRLSLDARDHLETVLASSDTLVFGRDVAPVRGPAGRYARDHANWVISRALHHGHTHVWVMGGRPCHPSRWCKYVSLPRNLCDGATTVDQLMQGLKRCVVEIARPCHRELSEAAGNLLIKRGRRVA